MEGMKVIDVLRELDPQMVIKVGAESGSCFFYVGTACDLKDNGEQYSSVVRRFWQQQYTNVYEREMALINKPPTLTQFAKDERERCNPLFSLKSYTEYVESWLRKVERCNKVERTMKERMESCEDILQRKIVSVFDTDPVVEKNVKTILIEGHEIGKWWMAKEAKKKPCIGLKLKDKDD